MLKKTLDNKHKIVLNEYQTKYRLIRLNENGGKKTEKMTDPTKTIYQSRPRSQTEFIRRRRTTVGPNLLYLAPHRSEAEIRSRRTVAGILKTRKITKNMQNKPNPTAQYARSLPAVLLAGHTQYAIRDYLCKTNPIQPARDERRKMQNEPNFTPQNVEAKRRSAAGGPNGSRATSHDLCKTNPI